MKRTGGVAAIGLMASWGGSDDESPRIETAEFASGCVNGIKGVTGDAVVEMLRMSMGGGGGAPPIFPAYRDPAVINPAPPIEPLPRYVSGDTPPWLPPTTILLPVWMCLTGGKWVSKPSGSGRTPTGEPFRDRRVRDRCKVEEWRV